MAQRQPREEPKEPLSRDRVLRTAMTWPIAMASAR